jgi:ABC-type sugar transport systems, ATPase components
MIILENVNKSFKNVKVLNNLNISFEDKKITVVIGRSGEGKSVMLKHIVGLLRPDSGRVLFNDIDLNAINKKELNELEKNLEWYFRTEHCLIQLIFLKM